MSLGPYTLNITEFSVLHMIIKIRGRKTPGLVLNRVVVRHQHTNLMGTVRHLDRFEAISIFYKAAAFQVFL